jgi:hypothetical protein
MRSPFSKTKNGYDVSDEKSGIGRLLKVIQAQPEFLANS